MTVVDSVTAPVERSSITKLSLASPVETFGAHLLVA
jgi:hypothetical protein